MVPSSRIWIQGAGEMASGAAITLLAAGYQVVLAEIANPLAVRRLVCFSEAVYEGQTTVGKWRGILVSAEQVQFEPGVANVLVDPSAKEIRRLEPDLVVDARMTKTEPVSLPWRGRPVIGLM